MLSFCYPILGVCPPIVPANSLKINPQAFQGSSNYQNTGIPFCYPAATPLSPLEIEPFCGTSVTFGTRNLIDTSVTHGKAYYTTIHKPGTGHQAPQPGTTLHHDTQQKR